MRRRSLTAFLVLVSVDEQGIRGRRLLAAFPELQAAAGDSNGPWMVLHETSRTRWGGLCWFVSGISRRACSHCKCIKAGQVIRNAGRCGDADGPGLGETALPEAVRGRARHFAGGPIASTPCNGGQADADRSSCLPRPGGFARAAPHGSRVNPNAPRAPSRAHVSRPWLMAMVGNHVRLRQRARTKCCRQTAATGGGDHRSGQRVAAASTSARPYHAGNRSPVDCWPMAAGGG